MHVFFVCDVFLGTHVGELTHLRPLHTQMSQVKDINLVGRYTLPPCSFSCASISKTEKKTSTFAHLSVPLQSFKPPMTQGEVMVYIQ